MSNELERTRNRERMRVVLKDKSKHEPCAMCGNVRLSVWRTLGGAPVCGSCYHLHFAPRMECSWCHEVRVPVVKRPPVCGICYWRARRGAKKRTDKANSKGEDNRPPFKCLSIEHLEGGAILAIPYTKRRIPMSNLGWVDPVTQRISIAYRRKGARQQHGFAGEVFVLDVATVSQKEQPDMKYVARESLPLVESVLDLTRISVVGIGGKRKHQIPRFRRFLSENSTFSGAILLYPGSGDWDLGEGALFLTSDAVLEKLR